MSLQNLAVSVALVAALALGIDLKLHSHEAHAVKAVQAHAAAVQASIAGKTATAATAILGAGVARSARTASIHTENSHAILSRPSAGLSAGSATDADAWRRGLCLYDSARGDPACAGL